MLGGNDSDRMLGLAKLLLIFSFGYAMIAFLRDADAESLYFMESALAAATVGHDQRERTIERFLTGTSDEIEIQVRNVTLEDLKEPPYKAVVEFDRVYGAARRPAPARASGEHYGRHHPRLSMTRCVTRTFT